jgi:opacity protein-like surface antigen
MAASLLLTAGASDAQTKKARRKRPAAAAPSKTNETRPPAQEATRPAPTTAPAPTPKPYEKGSTTAVSTSTDTAASTSSESAHAGPTPFPLVELSVGLRGFQRHLSYNDDVNGVLPSYDLKGAPAGRIGVAFYPLRTPKLSVGLVGSFEYAFALGSTFKTPPMGVEAKTYSTSSMQYAIGLRGNLLLGTATVFAGVDYLGQSFIVNLPDPTASNASVPDVKYSVVRPNVGVRVPLGDKFAVLGTFGYLFVLGAGEITSPTYFAKERSSVSGIDLSAGVSYALSERLEIRPVLDYRRYGFTFKPVTTDPYIAGGATDQYLGASVSVAYTF